MFKFLICWIHSHYMFVYKMSGCNYLLYDTLYAFPIYCELYRMFAAPVHEEKLLFCEDMKNYLSNLTSTKMGKGC